MKPLASWMPSMPTPTPISAVSSGRPAASSEPKVIVSTNSATITPSTSPIGGSLSTGAAEPPYSTCGAGVVRGGLRDRVGLRRADVGLRDRELQVGVGDPAVLGDAPVWTGRTPRRRPARRRGASRPARPPPCRASRPSARRTRRGPVAPSALACGTLRWISSIASWDSVPGTLNSSENVPFNAPARPPSATQAEQPRRQHEPSAAYREVSKSLQQSGHVQVLQRSSSRMRRQANIHRDAKIPSHVFLLSTHTTLP